ncbi:ATP-binding protein [Ancylobacter pratisalsi]|uniref:ATP-binding protein n=1 Tax=Ancylobacter pratisalsi TaxID=1745854 RepID=A0A6P1YS42_9HYPH|nr:ATP-binding protein [Ancylobacter pratisalsi]QIB35611.1 ATP-binding protein [Ancylobacter pratisalsi]
MTLREMDVRIANDLSEMEALVARIDDFSDAAGLPPKTTHRLHLAVDEFVNNAVDHGYPDGRRGEIAVHARLAGAVLELTLSDDGDAFDPFTAPEPDLDGSIEQRPIGGLGVHLVRNLARSFAYRRENGHNIVALTLSLD